MQTPFTYNDKRILIVDDQRAFQLMLKAMLHNFGAQAIQFASTGEQAVRLCKRQPFDILLVDYSLGLGKNGAQLLEELRTTQIISPNALFILISGDNYKRMVLNAVAMEPDDFITKPFSQHQLHSRVSRAHQKRQELLNVHLAFADKRYAHAVTSAKNYIDSDGRYSGYCRTLMIEARIQLKEYEMAQQELEGMLAHRHQTWAKATLGRVQLLREQYSEAIDTLTESIADSPMQLCAYDNLAKAYQETGQPEKAMDVIQRANALSPLSITRQQMAAELAIDSCDLTLAKESFARILKLSRRSVHRGPQHLCNFVRSLLEEAQFEEDLYRKNRLLREVSSVLLQARQEEGLEEHFDFDAFEGIIMARVHATKGELQKAKRLLFKTNDAYIDSPKSMQNALLPDTFLTLNLLGEYEYTIPLAKELNEREELDPFALRTANAVVENPDFKERLENFKQLNRKGIQAYEQERFDDACRYFDRALKQAPGNTGAVLNKIQVLVKILNQNTPNSQHDIEECHYAINSLDGLKLSADHQTRFNALIAEFGQIVQKHKAH